MKLVTLQSVVSDEAASVSGCSPPVRPRCFQRDDRTTSPPAPVPLRDRVHPLLSFLSYRVLPHQTCSVLALGAPSLGFSFPIATSARRIHLRASIPGSPYDPPPAFLTPSTVSSSSSFAGLFHPAATSGIHLPGVSPAAQPYRLVGDRYPPVVSRRSPAIESPRPCRILALRLQGVAPGSDPRSPLECLAPSTSRSPPRFSAPSGLSPDAWRAPSRPLRS